MVKKYDDRTEMEVVRARLDGVSFRRIYQEFGLHSSSVYHILKRHGIVHRGCGRGRGWQGRVGCNGGRDEPGESGGFAGGVGGSNWVKVIEDEPERPCSCCGKLFKPYVFEYQICKRLCFWCYTSDGEDGEDRVCTV
jgi:hypothetical protein